MSDTPDSPHEAEADEPSSVGVGEAAAASRLSSPRRLALVVAAVVVGSVIALMARPSDVIDPTGEAAGQRIRMPTTTTTTTTTAVKVRLTQRPKPKVVAPTTAAPTTAAATAPPTTAPDVDPLDPRLAPAVYDNGPEVWPTQNCCAPLTGLGYDDPAFANRPALAVKINNQPEADPQSGISRADVIFELKVEQFSRMIAIFHSRAVNIVGPVRSGRTSDPPILHGLGRPVVSYSGGNNFVMQTFANAENNGWLMNAYTNKVPHGTYFRTNDRPAPHNFYGHADMLFSARPGALPPRPLFQFLAPGASNPNAVPVSLIRTPVPPTLSRFYWDPSSRYFLRDQFGRHHSDAQSGARVARTSVVVLLTPYGISGADNRSPEAITTWASGEAWVFTGGTYVHGRWSRGESTDYFHLADDNGRPIGLYGGPIWVSLTDVAPTWQ